LVKKSYCSISFLIAVHIQLVTANPPRLSRELSFSSFCHLFYLTQGCLDSSTKRATERKGADKRIKRATENRKRTSLDDDARRRYNFSASNGYHPVLPLCVSLKTTDIFMVGHHCCICSLEVNDVVLAFSLSYLITRKPTAYL